MLNNLHVQVVAPSVHHTEHFFSGFILLPTGQLYALANSCEFDKGPRTLQWEYESRKKGTISISGQTSRLKSLHWLSNFAFWLNRPLHNWYILIHTGFYSFTSDTERVTEMPKLIKLRVDVWKKLGTMYATVMSIISLYLNIQMRNLMIVRATTQQRVGIPSQT